MASRQEVRSEETKRAILAAATALFAERGFEAVSIREIAKAAGCSHTTLYIYFKDKEALLHQLSKGPLQSLAEQMERTLADEAVPPEAKLREISRQFIRFCLGNRNMYTLFFMVKASRIDVEQPEKELQALRSHLFALLRRAMQLSLPEEVGEAEALAFSRIYFYTLHGIVGTYTHSEETLDGLLERLAPTFDLAVDVILAGSKQLMTRSG
ncbi:TetR/AcrR family transcriptional regulator [Brevibacillus agri]|uniref:TetR/AcrR family transcriptional regulator n=1 Tax=Brevibacillus TaxID=55080 RepID=UPI000271D4F7|nr:MULTISPECIES: TetR/AcrR family transcriptional regulator [Brevibacillus]ELK39667.1 transcriptional regulator [Brevibacillus agri BAB-2500]EJL41946.1 transcriptional regulator [Brevibacillus sp. CF112]MED3497688.1 TetR/AcrR family transcriptional regulator [Brevibacillus agri]MED4572750.1 TetR/AcrR family transcriptional regulator [Brevibacillus agri]WHX29173.1 TetR/AcrR family transcriptional regulator [Brevibacillus agri]